MPALSDPDQGVQDECQSGQQETVGREPSCAVLFRGLRLALLQLDGRWKHHPRPEAPEEAKAAAMPADHCVGTDDYENVGPVCPNAHEPRPEC